MCGYFYNIVVAVEVVVDAVEVVVDAVDVENVLL